MAQHSSGKNLVVSLEGVNARGDSRTSVCVLGPERSRPDAIFHIAAHANVRASFTTPLAVLNNNIMGTANLFEAVRLTGIDPVIQLCSTSEVYGQVDPKNVPINEDCPMVPASPYAV